MNPAARALDLLKAHWRPLAVVAALVFAFVGGRYSGPAKVVTRVETKTVVQEKVVTKTVQAKAEERVVYRDRTVIKRPDGTVIQKDVERREDSKRSVETAVRAETKTEVRSETKVEVRESAKPQWKVSLLAGVEPLHLDRQQLLGPVALGAQVERRIVGPLWGGVWALSSGQAGVSLGFEF